MDPFRLSLIIQLHSYPLIDSEIFSITQGCFLNLSSVADSLWIFTNFSGGMRSTLSKLRLKGGGHQDLLSLVEENENILLKHDGEWECVKPEPFIPSSSVKRLQQESFFWTSVSLSAQRPPVGGALLLYFVSFPLAVLIRKSPLLSNFF